MHNKLIRRTHIALSNATLTWFTLAAVRTHKVARFGTTIAVNFDIFFLHLAIFRGRNTHCNRAISFLGSLFSVTLEFVVCACFCVIEVKVRSGEFGSFISLRRSNVECSWQCGSEATITLPYS